MSENPQSAPAQRYTAELAGQIETKWQDRWEELGTFYADNPTGDPAGLPQALLHSRHVPLPLG